MRRDQRLECGAAADQRRHRRGLIGVTLADFGLDPRDFANAPRPFLAARPRPGVSGLGTIRHGLLASQAAISLENTRLYHDLTEREARIRRLVDANIIGICLWKIDGDIIEANDAFLRIVGYEREDLVSGRVHRRDLTPAEWQERDERTVAELRTIGIVQPFEKEYLRKDGSRVPVLVGAATFEEGSKEGVSFVLDLSGRKRAEAEAREMQLELAHANRVATMGQLTASVAHEVNQPIAATTGMACGYRR